MSAAIRSLALALGVGAALVAAPPSVARPGGGFAGSHASGGGWHRGGPAWHGGYGGGYRHGGYARRGHWGPGVFWGGLGLGLGLGAIGYATYGGYYLYPAYAPMPYPGYVVVEPPAGDVVVRSGQPVPIAQRAADPIFYPRNGQSAARTEADRQECNRWATTQSGAMADASIFQRATLACMEGRGYTVK